MSANAIEVIVPVLLSPEDVPATFPARRRPPPDPVIGLVDNTKSRAQALLVGIADVLRAQGHVAGSLLHSKATAARPIPLDERTDLVARAHLVLSGVGDCGACTSCTVHDAVLCEELGVPAAVVVTEPFLELATHTARNLGRPGLLIVMVDHPLFVRDDAWIAVTAAAVAPVISAGLLG